jgi:membrane-associated phospholipid phosphatase
MRKIYIIFSLIFLFVFNSYAFENTVVKKKNTRTEKTSHQKKEQKKTPFFKALGQDLGHILSSPLRIRGKDVLVIGSVVLITGVLINNDEKIYRDFKDFQAKHEWVDNLSPKITKMGDGGFNLGVSGLFYLGGMLFKSNRAKETAKLTLMTFIHTGVVVQIGKHLAGRQRPSWDNGNDGWAGPSGFFKRYEPYKISHYDAFPSGHTISIFGTATVIAEMYKDKPIVPIVSYSLATLCGLSRVTEDTHWMSDVFLGAVLGYVIGKYVVKKRSTYKRNSFNIIPSANSRGISLGIRYNL